MDQHDFELVQKCLSGDRSAFKPLVESYQSCVFGSVMRMVHDIETARDISQEAFVKAYTKLDTFDMRYPFKVWIMKIAVNTAIDFLRKSRPQDVSLDSPVETDDQEELKRQIPDNRLSPQQTLEKKETSEIVRKAVMSLDPKLRAVIVLRHFEEMDYEQIAEVLQIPLGSVKNRLFRARERLQAILMSQPEFATETIP